MTLGTGKRITFFYSVSATVSLRLLVRVLEWQSPQVDVLLNVLHSWLQRKSHFHIPRKGNARPQSQFSHSCVCVCDRSWVSINRSQTHECGNWHWGRAISFLGIFFSSNFRYVFLQCFSKHRQEKKGKREERQRGEMLMAPYPYLLTREAVGEKTVLKMCNQRKWNRVCI